MADQPSAGGSLRSKAHLRPAAAEAYAWRMKPRPRQSWPFLVVIAALGIILVLLAVLQYRWSGQISAAERARMQAILNTSAGQFRGELVSELHRICSAF